MITRQTPLILFAASLSLLSGCSSSDNSASTVNNDPLSNPKPLTGASLAPEHLQSSLGDGLDNDQIQTPNPGSTTPGLSRTEVLNIEYPSLLWNIAGYPLEDLAANAMIIGHGATLSNIGHTPLDSGSYSVDDQGHSISLPLSRAMFACKLGGELTVESAQLAINELFYSRDSVFTHYAFNQCRLTEQGEQVLDGSVQTLSTDISGHHYTLQQKHVTLISFSLIQDADDVIEASGTISVNEFDSFNSDLSRQVDISNYSKTVGTVITEHMDDARFLLSSNTSASESEHDYLMNAQARTINLSGIGASVMTNPHFSRHWSSDTASDNSVPFSGQLLVSADDGSQLTLTAADVADTAELYVDLNYRDSNGQTDGLSAQKLVSLPFYSPSQ